MPRNDQSYYVLAKKYPGLENARKACLLGNGKNEIVGWHGKEGRGEARGEELWPDQDWGEKVEERWCLRCEKWYGFDELTAKAEGKKGWRKPRWFVSCPEGHNFFQTKKRLNWILGLMEMNNDKIG